MSIPKSKATEEQLHKAMAFYQQGQYPKALKICRALLKTAPEAADVWHLAGVIHMQGGDLGLAIEHLESAIRYNATDPHIINNLGAAHRREGNDAKSLTCFERAIEISPGFAPAYFNKGNLLEMQNQLEAARDSYIQALDRHPDYTAAHYNLAMVLDRIGSEDSARRHYHQVLGLNPHHSGTLNNLGNLARRHGEAQEALAYYQRSLAAEPGNTEALINVGNLCQELRHYDQALAAFQQAISRQNNYAAPHVGRACIQMHWCDFKGLAESRRLLLEKLDNFIEYDHTAWCEELIYLAPLISLSPTIRKRLTNLVNQRLSLAASRPSFNPHITTSPDRRLKIGYLSPDFGDHPISHVLRGVWQHHNRKRFEILAFSLRDRSAESAHYYQDMVKACDRFIDLSSMSPRKAARKIADHGVHILIDLAGYMQNARPAILACRPAPVQIYWLGHGGDLGLDCIDYVLVDQTVAPPDATEAYKAAPIRLPEVYHSTDRAPISQKPLCRADFGLPEEAVVFCAFNNPQKIDAQVFGVWMAILQAVPNSCLWLSNPTGSQHLVENLIRTAESVGIHADQLIFAERVPEKALHLARHRLADLFLDTFVYNASTTAIDALWAGLPIVTYKGNRFYSRICSSFLKQLDLDELICDAPRAYQTLAVALGRNPSRLRTLKKSLAERLKTSPLFDTPRFTHHLEKALEMAWQKKEAGLKPASFKVPRFL